jgi:hypothetical protein
MHHNLHKRLRGGESSGGDIVSQQISAGIVPRPDPRYYSTFLTAANQGDVDGAHGQIAAFSEMRTTNLVPQTNAYQVAVERATVDTKALPSFIAEVDETQGDPNVLAQRVGFKAKFTGSLFPSTRGGSVLSSDNNEYIFTSCGGSSLPIKYYRNPYGARQNNDDNLTGSRALTPLAAPACMGVLQAYIENNPNSAYWQGVYTYNISSEQLLPSFQRALNRAFGTWQAVGIYVNPSVTYPQPVPQDPLSTFYLGPSPYNSNKISLTISNVPSQCLDENNADFTIDQYFLTSWQQLNGDPIITATDTLYRWNGFYPVANKQFGGSYPFVVLNVPQWMKDRYNNSNGGLTAQTGNLRLCAMMKKVSQVPTVGVQILYGAIPPTTSTPQLTSITYKSADSQPYFYFNNIVNEYLDHGLAYPSMCVFDFFDSPNYNNVVQLNFAAERYDVGSFASDFVNEFPTREDFLYSALVLGFLPDITFNIASTDGSAGTAVFSNRPISPAFLTQIQIENDRPLIWKPVEENATQTPVPNGPYYYAYGTSYVLDNVVNPSIESCFNSETDKLFTNGVDPVVVLNNVGTLSGIENVNVTAISDLSLNAQLYCCTYYNSGNASYDSLRYVQAWNPVTTYGIGSPCFLGTTDELNPITNLYIANKPMSSGNSQQPVAFSNTEFWIYCGPFIFSTAVVGGKYLNELVTWNGFALKFSGTWDGWNSVPNNKFTYMIVSQPTTITYGGIVDGVNVLLDNVSGSGYMLKPTPVIGTSPPVMLLNNAPGDHGDVFELRLDTFGFGTYDSKDPQNPIKAYARDSWGNIASAPNVFLPYRVYSEFLVMRCNTAFQNLFRGFSTRTIVDQQSTLPSTAPNWVFDFVIDPSATPAPAMPLPIQNAFFSTEGSLRPVGQKAFAVDFTSITHFPSSYEPTYRNADKKVYYWTELSSETSRYCGWDPVQSIVIEGNTLPITIDNLPVSEPVNAGVLGNASGNTRMLLAEWTPIRAPGEGSSIYEPQVLRELYFAPASDLKFFAYNLFWRNKFTGLLVPLRLSQRGSALVIFRFVPKY